MGKIIPIGGVTRLDLPPDRILEAAKGKMEGVVIVGFDKDGEVYAASSYADGGRVLVCVGLGDTIKEARDRAYLRCGQVHFAGKKLRTDIAYQAL